MGIPILGDLIEEIGDLASEFIVDKDKRNELRFKIRELGDRENERIHQQMLAQIEVNKVEAGHRSIFIAGWRPAVGWVGAAGLAFQCIVFPIMKMFGLPDPGLDTELLILTMSSILGVGVMRSYDKQRGTSNDAPLGRPKASESVSEVPPGFGDPPDRTPWE